MKTPLNYWEDGNGRIVCSVHAGNYLSHAINSRPNAKRHKTPLGTWEVLNSLEVMMMQAEFGVICESCRFNAKEEETK